MAMLRNSAKSSLEEIGKIVSQSFGPCGKDVLLKSSTGTIFVTNNGLSILRHLDMSHPIGSWLKDTIQNFVNKHGDYSKTFIIVLTHLFRLFSELIASSRNLNSDLSRISQSIMSLKSHLRRNDIACFMDREMLLLRTVAYNLSSIKFDSIYNNFISGKFNSKTCSQLYSLCDAIFKQISLSKKNLEFLIFNYDNVCVTVSNTSLEQSKCVEGVIIQHEVLPKKVNIQKCCFILISGKLSRTKNSGNHIQFSEKVSIKSREVNKIEFFYQFVELLKRHSVNLIFFEERVDKSLQKILEVSEIAFIQFTSEEELKYLSKIYDITILSGIYDVENISKNEIGCAQWFRSCILGRYSCSHLGPKPPISHKSFYFQIILCSLNDGLGKEYSETLLNFFKVLLMSFDSNLEFLLIPACGVYEMALTRYLLTNCRSLLHSEIIAKALLEIPKLLFSNSTMRNMKRLILNLDSAHIPYGIDGISGKLVDIGEITLFESFNSKCALYDTILEFCAQIFRVDKLVSVNKKEHTILALEETDSD